MLCGLIVLRIPVVKAEACQAGSYQSTAQLPAYKVDIYAKLSDGEANGKLSVNTIDDMSGCFQTTSTKINGSGWTRLGSIPDKYSQQVVSLDLNLGDQAEKQGASAPQVLISPSNGMNCRDINNCLFDFAGQSYQIVPQKISFNSDTLIVAQHRPIKSDVQIRSSLFYDNNELVYSDAKTDAVFDKRYLTPGEHIVKTVRVLKDGQALVKEEKVVQAFTLSSLIWPMLLKNQLGVRAVISGAVLLFAYTLLISLIRRYYRQLLWRRSHVAGVRTIKSPKLSQTDRYENIRKLDSIKKSARSLGALAIVPLSLLGLYVFTDSFILSRFKVDGISMETTLRDKTSHFYLKLPVTLAGLNNKNIKLKRGDVVVVRHDDNNLFLPASASQSSFVVKRVLALPGERIKQQNGRLIVFNQSRPDGFDVDKDAAWSSVITTSGNSYLDLTIKEGEVFLAGDDRENSIDSRFYGPVKISDVAGLVIYPQKRDLKPYQNEFGI